jgi:prepilin-type processing-associated H-X9-DG protein
MKIKNFLLISILFIFCSCSEEKRYDINSTDKVPPGTPVYSLKYDALNGAVRIYYTPPADADVISVEAEYKRESDGKVFRFATSYFANSILVNGMSDTIDYDVKLFAVDRAGNQSPSMTCTVRPLESAILKVNRSMMIKGGFDAVFVKWENELRETVNAYINYTFTMDGSERTLNRVFTSSNRDNKFYISDLALPPDSPIKIKYKISDDFGNFTEEVEIEPVKVLKDKEIPKFDADRNPLWLLPESRSVPLAEQGNTVSQAFGRVMDGKLDAVIDGRIDEIENLNFMMDDAGIWNVMIKLDKYYELSRILTHQRHGSGGNIVYTDGSTSEEFKRGGYYRMGNVGQYRLYRWDDETRQWELINVTKLPIPSGTLSDLEWYRLGRAGDIAYMYPDDPHYTKPTEWIRYEAISVFDNNYSGGACCLSEITLFCKPENLE